MDRGFRQCQKVGGRKNIVRMSEQTAINKSAEGAHKQVPLATLFRLFLKLGSFTLGGGYGMLPLVETEVVEKKKWISKTDFLDIIAIAQSCPGPFVVNLSVYIGYHLQKNKGAVAACMGAILPSFVIILLIALFFHAFMDVPFIAAMFRGIRPAVVALIAVPTFTLAKDAKITFSTFWIPLTCAFLIWALGVNPIWIILVAGIGGYIYGKFIMPIE